MKRTPSASVKYPIINLYISQRKKEIDNMQQEYDEAIHIITEVLDTIESILNKQMLLTGYTMIEREIRLFVTLIRFDDIYRLHLEVNIRKIFVMTSV